MIESLPNKLLCYLFEFLDHQDYFAVAVSCKRFSEVFKDHNKYWIRECFGRYFSFELDLYSEIYQSEDYKMYIKNKIYSLTKKLWKQHLVQGEKQKKQFSLLLTQIATKESADSFVNFISQTLREPNLPVYRLKRETIIQTTQTFFQNKLSEILYEDTIYTPKGFNLVDENKSLIDELQNHADKLFQDTLMHNKKELLQARWYLFETNDNLLDETISLDEKSEDMDLESHNLPSLKRLSNASTEDLALVKNDHRFLISLYDCLQNMLNHFCGLVLEYLNSLDNVYDLIAEYNARWRTYVCSMLELEKTFETFTSLINKNYETIFEGYPCFPKFSILRLMTKTWMKQVYEKAGLNRYLNDAFLQILANYREKNLQKALGDNSSILFIEDQDNNKLPKCLYVNLQTKNRQSLSSESSDYCQLTENIQTFFGGCVDAEKELLSNFMQSILDISLTEVNIHYLDCSELPVTCPYRELEELFIQSSNDFYESYEPLFGQNPEYFCHFLKSDDCLFSDVLIQRTKAKFETLHFKQGLSFMKNMMHEQLQKINLQELTQCEKQSFICEQRGETEEFMETVVRQIIEEAEKENLCKDISNFDLFSLDHLSNEEQMSDESNQINPCVVEHINDKSFLHKVVLAIESKCSHIKNDFGYLIQRQKSLEKGREMDQYIKQNNKDKNIPFEMGDVDNLFYDLDKDVSIPLLEKLYEDYLIFMKEQGKEGLSLGDLPDLDEEMGDNNNNNQDLGILGNFEQNLNGDFMEDLDFMNLDNLQLRRTLM